MCASRPCRFLFSVSGGSIHVSVLSFWWVHTGFCSQFLVGPYTFLFSVSGGSIQVSVLSFWWVHTRFCSPFLEGPYRFQFSVSGGCDSLVPKLVALMHITERWRFSTGTYSFSLSYVAADQISVLGFWWV